MNTELNELIKENTNLIYSICSKYNYYRDKEDLYQEGVKGLINAYNNYNKNMNTKFSTYAFPYIVGEVSTYVREDKALKVSKDYIRLGKKINEYILKYKEVRGCEPKTIDIANMLEIPVEKVITAMEACMSSKSLEDEIIKGGKPVTLLDVTPKPENVSKEQMLDLKEAFKYLSSQEQALIVNRYFKDLTQSEVADLLGVNQVYVSRLEKKAITKMRNKMVA